LNAVSRYKDAKIIEQKSNYENEDGIDVDNVNDVEFDG